MLSKKERLSRDAFNRFFSVGKRFRSDSFDLIYAPHPTFHGAVVISKKVASRAVARNTMRRRVYSLLHEQGKSGIWIVILRKTPQIPSRATLKGELARFHTKLLPD